MLFLGQSVSGFQGLVSVHLWPFTPAAGSRISAGSVQVSSVMCSDASQVFGDRLVGPSKLEDRPSAKAPKPPESGKDSSLWFS